MTNGRKKKARTKARSKKEIARELEQRALARGIKPFTTVKERARGTPKDADELLAAIRLLRADDEA